MKLDDLPRYVEEPFGAMWRLPDDFQAGSENVYVRLADVEKLLEENQRREVRNTTIENLL